MRIAILTDGFPPQGKGGAEQIAFQHAQFLAATGHEVVVITTVRESLHAGVVQEGTYQVHRLVCAYHERWRAYRSLWNPVIVAQVKKIIAEFKPDVVHAHNIHTNLSYACLSVARRYASTVCLTFHDAMSFDYGKVGYLGERAKSSLLRSWQTYGLVRVNPIRNYCIRRALRSCTHLFAVSEALAERIRQHGIAPVVVHHNGIAVSAEKKDPVAVEAFRRTHGLMGKRVLFFGGRVSALKGASVALEVLRQVRKVRPDTVMLVAGSPQSVVSLKKEAEQKEMVDALVFAGWLSADEMRCAYALSDVVLVLSLYCDPFPTIVLEAMAAGVPVIATKWGGAQEALVDGVTGFVVDPTATMDVAQAVMKLLRDEDLRQRFGRAGRERVVAHFNQETLFNKLLTYYGA